MSGVMKISEYLLRIEEIRARRLAFARPFEDLSPSASAKRRERAAADPAWFLRTYLPHWFETELAPFHRDLVEISLEENRPTATVGPRGFGKSTVVSFGMPLWKLLLGRRRFGAVMSATRDLAANFVTAIRDEFDSNERILADFGPQKVEGQWTQTDFRIAAGGRLAALGRSQQVRGLIESGRRPDFLVLDDLEDEDLSRSPERAASLVSDLVRQAIPALAPSGWEFSWIGTKLSATSALAQVVDGTHEHSAAFRSRIFRSRDSRGESIAPLVKSTDYLDRQRELLGERTYLQEYEGQISAEGTPFPPPLARFYPDSLLDSWGDAKLTAFSDPAVNRTAKSDWKTIAVAALLGGRWHLAHARLRRESHADFVRAHHEIWERFGRRIKTWRFEANGFQDIYFDLFRAETQRRGEAIPLVPWTSTESKDRRIERLSPYYQRGDLLFNRRAGDTNQLLNQLWAWPRAEHDDGPDALSGAVDAGRESAARVTMFARPSRPGSRRGGFR